MRDFLRKNACSMTVFIPVVVLLVVLDLLGVSILFFYAGIVLGMLLMLGIVLDVDRR